MDSDRAPMVQPQKTRRLRIAAAGGALCVSLGSSGCYAESEDDETLEEPLVVTARDSAMNFAALESFFIRPEIPVVAQMALETREGDDGNADEEEEGRERELLAAALAAPLLAATEENLLARGYVRAASASEADMAVALVYLRALRSDYDCYGAYSDWSYWGYSATYPYSAPYSCSEVEWTSGMIATDIIDLTSAPPPSPSADASSVAGILRGFWFSGVYGVEMGSQRTMVQRAVEGIDQSFAQSPYFTRIP